jgi:type VI secretion system protein ImpB
MSRSIHDKLGRVRPPRVHIKYEVHTGDAVVLKELPFVMGVMGDFSAHPQKRIKSGPKKGEVEKVDLDPLKDRKFIEIDRDNFNQVMSRLSPGLNFRVENTLAGDGSEFGVQLAFESLEDFEPARVAQQVEPLRKLLETRTRLRDLRNRVDLDDKLEELLESILKDQDDKKVNTENVKKLQADLQADLEKRKKSDTPENK